MKQPNRNKVRVEERRASAAERKVLSDLSTPAERLAELDQRLGVGVGALKERIRLGLKISSINTGTVAVSKAEKKSCGLKTQSP